MPFDRKPEKISEAMKIIVISSLFLILGDAAALSMAPKPTKILHSSCDNLLKTCEHPRSCPILKEEPPPVFDVTLKTSKGRFTLRTVTAWAPPYARRWWQLSRLNYMQATRFQRVVWRDFSGSGLPPFVVQFGYSGEPRAPTPAPLDT